MRYDIFSTIDFFFPWGGISIKIDYMHVTTTNIKGTNEINVL